MAFCRLAVCCREVERDFDPTFFSGETGMEAVYPSDLTDAEWNVLKGLMPKKKTKRGRPREVEYRTVLNAVFYVNKEGCQWRAVPKEYCPWQTAYHYFNAWRKSGLWQEINDRLRRRVRLAEGRHKEPSVGILDSQSVKTTEKRGPAVTMRARRSKAASGT
jgi:transposase